MLAGPVPRELVGDAAAARAALQRPLQRFLARRLRFLRRAAKRLQPVRHDLQVLVLVERIERHPQAEALRQGNLLLHRLAGMDLVADVLGLEVLLHVLRHQVAPVRGGVDQQVLGGGRNRAVERHLERDVAVLGAVEGEVVAEHEEALRPPRHLVGDLRQVDEVVLLHLDQAQALLVVLVEQALDDGGLARAARAGEQHVVGRPALDELPRVLLDLRDLRVDALQVGQPHAVHVAHRLQPAARVEAGGPAPAEGDARVPVGGAAAAGGSSCSSALEQFLDVLAHDRYSALIFT